MPQWGMAIGAGLALFFFFAIAGVGRELIDIVLGALFAAVAVGIVIAVVRERVWLCRTCDIVVKQDGTPEHE